MDPKYTELVRQTIQELEGIMEVPFKDRVKDLAKGALGRSVRAKDPMFWPAGMLLLGLAEARKLFLLRPDDASSRGIIRQIDAAVLNHLRLWKDKYGEKIGYIDDALAAAALLKMVPGDGVKGPLVPRDGVKGPFSENEAEGELADLIRYFADRMYEYLENAPKNKDGVIVYNASKTSNIFADGVGQTSMFLSLYGQRFGEEQALDLAGQQLLAFRNNAMDEKSSLPYHGYGYTADGKTEKKGVLSWGRAAGWLIMGLSEYVKCIGGKVNAADGKKTAISEVSCADWYKELSETLLKYMRPDGGYSWQVQALEGHLDTSATGMILYGLVNRQGGNETGEDTDEDKGFTAEIPIIRSKELMESVITGGRVQSALSPCEDFGVHYQTYGHYPWGQGAVLAALSLISGK